MSMGMSPSKVQKGTVLSASGVTHASRFQLECRATNESPDPAPASEPPTTATTGVDQGRNAFFGVTSDIAVSTLSAARDLVSLGARHSHTGWRADFSTSLPDGIAAGERGRQPPAWRR